MVQAKAFEGFSGGCRVRVVSWDPSCERSAQLAARLGCDVETIHYLAYRRPAVAPVKYFLQTIKTIVSLVADPPRFVLISSPPPFGAFAVYLASFWIPGLRYVVDCHTGVFLEPKWKWLTFISRFVSRRAVVTLVTNQFLRGVVEGWGARALVLPNPLPRPAKPDRRYAVEPTQFNVAAVFSFYEDEPVESFMKVRDIPPDVRVYVTGDYTRARRLIPKDLCPQIILCGFLTADEYNSLLQQAHAVLVLCTRPHTLLQGAAEAAAARKPLITSDWPEMREQFRKGTVFVSNSTLSIEAGISEARHRHAELAAEMTCLAAELEREWERDFGRLLSILPAGQGSMV